MDFGKRIKSVKRESVFSLKEEGFIVWCSTIVKGDDDKYYMYFSFWPEDKGFEAWVTHSKIGYAVSDSPLGPFTYCGIALSGAGGNEWDRDCVHNPAAIKIGDTYYIYYMGNYGNGEYWDHRNHQRVGVAYSKDPRGPFKRLSQPVIDISEEGADSLMTSNPAVAVGKDGKIYMIYKAVSKYGKMPKGGAVVCKMAVSDSPLGEFKKHDGAIMINPENDWSVEDPCIWYEGDRFYSLVKDFQGYFTKDEEASVALFESKDGFDWKPSEHVLAFRREITWDDGITEKLFRMERPQVYLENSKPAVLCCACRHEGDDSGKDAFCVQIGIGEEK